MTGKFDFIKKQLSQKHSLIKFELERPSRRLPGDLTHRMAYLAGVEDVVKVLNSSWRRLKGIQKQPAKQKEKTRWLEQDLKRRAKIQGL